MSPQRIDPASALKKLFERRGSSRRTSPEALFRPGLEGARPPAPALAPALEKPGVQVGLSSRRGMFAGLGRVLRRFPLSLRGSRLSGAVGVDIGRSAIKVVHLQSVDGGYRMTGVSIEEISTGPVESLAYETLVRDHLQVLKGKGQLHGPVVLGFHHQDSIVESMRLPKMPAEELQQAVIWEAQERLSLKPDRSIIRYIANGDVTVDGQAQMEILLVGVPRESLLASWRILAEMELNVIAVEPTSLAGFYPLSRLNLWKPTEVTGHLEIGAKVSHLSFIRGGTVRFNRSFPVAGESVSQAIADYCQKEFAEAEQLKCLHGISKMALEEDRHETGHEQEDRVRISHALGLHLEQLVAEIEHSYRYFAFELGGADAQKMDQLLITGGGGLLKYLPDFLSSRLSVPVVLIDPLRGIEVDPALQPLLQPGWGQRLTVALGLAMRPILSRGGP